MGTILIKTASAEMNNNRMFSGGLYALLKKAAKRSGTDIKSADVGNAQSADKIIVYDLYTDNLNYVRDCVNRGLQHKLILMLWEGPSIVSENWDLNNHQYFPKILTWDNGLVDEKKYFKFYYPQSSLQSPFLPAHFNEKKLCSLIASNKTLQYQHSLTGERTTAIQFFETHAPNQFDLYGQIPWDFKSYRGSVASKELTYANYKFAICYENTRTLKGYVTEKIFDCFRAGCIPIYYGAEDVTDDIPPNTFIDRRAFVSYPELLECLMSIDEKRYNEYLWNIARYANSDSFYLYTWENFINIMLTHMTPG